MMNIRPSLCRAARALLDWTQRDLAKTAGVALNTVINFESGKSVPIGNNLAAIQNAFEVAGIKFLADGVRLPK